MSACSPKPPSREQADLAANMVARIMSCVRANEFAAIIDADLRCELAAVLNAGRVPFVRGYQPRGSSKELDFLVLGGVAVIARTGGAFTQTVRDLTAVASHPEVEAVVLVSAYSAHRLIPTELSGKMVAVVMVGNGK